MKKIIAILAVAFALTLTTQANTSVIIDEETTVVAQNDEFVVVKLEDLAENVQVAIKGEIEKAECTIKEVLQNKENKDIKVVGVNAEEAEVTFLFDESGKLK
jgi:hypothetical protein